MPLADSVLRAVVGRPLIVIVGHVPIVVIVVFTIPLWLLMPFFPVAQPPARFLIRELRSWSAQVMQAGIPDGAASDAPQ